MNGGNNNIALIGYSGHAYVVADIFMSMGRSVTAYCEKSEKANPFGLSYLGSEDSLEVLNTLKGFDYFVAIGDNNTRKKVLSSLLSALGNSLTAMHSRSVIGYNATIGTGSMICAGSVINPFVKIGKGVICNTGSIVEHECELADFVHIAPGAVLAGNVKVGECSFIGANAVVKQGITIGSNVIVGAGAVVLKDIPDNTRVVGNPQRII